MDRNKLLAKLLVSITLFGMYMFRNQLTDLKSTTDVGYLTRNLLGVPAAESSCITEKSAVEEFPHDIFTQEQRQNGFIIVHILITLYVFGLLAVVCDGYFVVSLYHICSRLKLDNDVAGATFMAVGSSAPTLFISVVSIFFTESGGDIGLGTIVGSTIFNTLFIIAICGFASGGGIDVAWYPLLRDSFMYICGTLALILTIKDREVYWYEAMSFVFIYLAYIIVMYFNKRLERIAERIKNTFCFSCSETDETESELLLDNNQFNNDNIDLQDLKGDHHITKMNIKDEETQTNFNHQIYDEKPSQLISTEDNDENNTTITSKDELAQYEHKQESPFNIPKGCLRKMLWLLGMPVIFLFYITIPPCCKRRWSEWFLVTFLMSVLWMGVLSYVLVWMVCLVGFTFNIPDCVMGMTFLAAGSSIPDVMSSVIVARQGEGNMAIANAIGSNVFDMLCLGLPWLLKTTLMNPGTTVSIQSKSIMISAMLLIGSIVFTILAVQLNAWRLDGKLGFIFLVVYLVFISLATLVEFIACPCQLEV